MQIIQKYRAEDGAEFNDQSACAAHEALCAEIAEVMAMLPNRPKDEDCRFSNGHGYLQHTQENFWKVRDALLRIAAKLCPHKWIESAINDRTIHPSWPGRIISETSNPLWRAWHRIMCIDKEFREWGQPYYADKPQEAEAFELQAG